MASLLWNVSDGAIGIVPYGSGEDFNRNPIGSGPFRFVSAQQDKNVVIERNPDYWATPAKLERVEFRVIPDATTRALELRKRSADVVSNALTPDMVLALQKDDGLELLRGPGTIYAYLALNLRDPTLRDVRVRRALAYSIDLAPIIHYLVARPGAPGLQRAAAAALGLRCRRSQVPLRSGAGAQTARRSRLSARTTAFAFTWR